MILVTRSAWGARDPDPPLLDMDEPAPEQWIHHAAFFLDDEAEMVRDIQLAHMHLGYRDVAYNFLVGQSGSIYEGRGWGHQNGADGSDHDKVSITWCFLINSNVTEPTQAALDAVREHRGIGLKGGHIVGDIDGGHRDIDATSCPGNKVYTQLDYMRTPWEDDMTEEEHDWLKHVHGDADRIMAFVRGVREAQQGLDPTEDDENYVAGHALYTAANSGGGGADPEAVAEVFAERLAG